MAKILDMPKLSPTMEEGVLSMWHKKEGESVAVDDLLAEVETDKATMEFRAFDKGTLLKLLVPAGTQVKLGQAVAILGSPGDDISGLVSEAQKGQPAQPAPAAAPPAAPPAAVAPAPAAPAARAAPAASVHILDRTEHLPDAPPPADGRVLASPYVRKTARDLGIDLRRARGSGRGGRVVHDDLQALAKGPRVASPPSLEPEVRPLSMMRKTIARRLTESKSTVPHFYLTIDVDAAALVSLREQINGDLAGAAKVSVNDLLIKAVATALVQVPECNAQFTPDAILIHKRVDISVAVAVPDGLVTPVVRHADRKSIVAIAQEVRDLATRAKAKKLSPEEMRDGTFSISNLGMFGIDAFSAVINPPEGAILAVGRVRDEPVVKDGAVVSGKKLAMTLSCDHRVIDGAIGAAFLAALRTLVERPVRMLVT